MLLFGVLFESVMGFCQEKLGGHSDSSSDAIGLIQFFQVQSSVIMKRIEYFFPYEQHTCVTAARLGKKSVRFIQFFTCCGKRILGVLFWPSDQVLIKIESNSNQLWLIIICPSQFSFIHKKTQAQDSSHTRENISFQHNSIMSEKQLKEPSEKIFVIEKTPIHFWTWLAHLWQVDRSTVKDRISVMRLSLHFALLKTNFERFVVI